MAATARTDGDRGDTFANLRRSRNYGSTVFINITLYSDHSDRL